METLRELFNAELFRLFDTSISVKNILLLAALAIVTQFMLRLYKAFVFKTLSKKELFDEERTKLVYKIGRTLLIILAVYLVFLILNLKEVWSGFMNYEIVHEQSKDEGFSMKVYNIFLFIIIIIIGRLMVKVISSFTRKRLHANPRLDAAQEFTITKLVTYGGFILTFLVAVNGAGFNLTALLFGSAALLLALGLGIQHIFDDFISGLILLFDGTFQVGDVIESDGLVGQVKHIDIRTSKIITRDGVTVIIPNRKLTSDKIDNWTTGSPVARYSIDVGVAYGSDVKKVKELLFDCAMKHPDTSKSKPIQVQFSDFGESALEFTLLFWTTRNWDIYNFKSELRFAIHEKFRENGVQIPFPQRDVHIHQRQTPSTF